MRSSGYAAVVPVRGNNHLTGALLSDLERDDTYGQVIVIDNGSDSDDYLVLHSLIEATPRAQMLSMPGAGIHQMWNAGLRFARVAGFGLAAILNNDIHLEPGCLDRLAEVMADPAIGIACPNYDGRPERGLVDVDTVCGGLYDGTGGMAGFAFMIRTHGYRFPEELKWWYGDQHVLACMLARGLRAVIVTDAHCEHVGGGSQTGRWDTPSMQRQIKADERVARRLVAR